MGNLDTIWYNTRFLWPNHVRPPNGIFIGSDVFAGHIRVTNRQTDHATCDISSNRPHLWHAMHAMRPNDDSNNKITSKDHQHHHQFIMSSSKQRFQYLAVLCSKHATSSILTVSDCFNTTYWTARNHFGDFHCHGWEMRHSHCPAAEVSSRLQSAWSCQNTTCQHHPLQCQQFNTINNYSNQKTAQLCLVVAYC